MAKSDKPNILIIWGDDIGYWNISRYSMGMMGYQTPNIDRIGAEGATFTDWYASRAAPPAAPASSPVRTRSAPAC
jgi:arylsulfatase A-like enzyme